MSSLLEYRLALLTKSTIDVLNRSSLQTRLLPPLVVNALACLLVD
jgi:hypothetical protein